MHYITDMIGNRWYSTLAVGALTILATACTTQPAADPAGAWGGDHIALSVTADGATLEYDCATGLIDEVVSPDAEGRFHALGSHDIGHGGPVKQGELPDRHPASYRGHIAGDTMTLTVTLTDRGMEVGTFELTRGAVPRIVRCL